MTEIKTVSINFTKQCQTIKSYEEALALVYWDMRTGIPPKGTQQRSEVVGLLSAEIFRLSTAPEFMKNLTFLKTVQDEVEPLVQALVIEMSKKAALFEAIPADEYAAYAVLQSKAEAAWSEARDQSDYKIFQPHLEEIIAYKKKIHWLLGQKSNRL